MFEKHGGAYGAGNLIVKGRGSVKEREILRVVVGFNSKSRKDSVEVARKEILMWAQRRSGGGLSRDAWGGKNFEFFSGGRTTIGVSISSEENNIWALRTDDPDKNIAGRVWTTEVTVGRAKGENPKLGVRLLVSSSEDEIKIDPHVPGFLRQIMKKANLFLGQFNLRSPIWRIESEEEAIELISLIRSPDRRIPVFVASGDERSADPDSPIINVNVLSQATLGLAITAILPAKFTYALTDAFGKARSVYHGGVRVYQPGFNDDASPYSNRLFLSDTLSLEDGAERCVRELQALSAKASLRRERLGRDILAFSAVRSAVLRAEQLRRVNEGASEAERLIAAQNQIDALEKELQEARDWQNQLISLHEEAEERAVNSESQAKSSEYRIQMLLQQIKEIGADPDSDVPNPESWDDFPDWCDQFLAGRLVLTPSARRGIKKAEFEDIKLAARCLLWLANDCRNRRIEGGGSVSEFAIEEGVRNSSCGGDAYEFEFRGRRITADWHVKNGGNTRDPIRCLRIYYGWDSETQQIIVSEMPAHRRTGAS